MITTYSRGNVTLTVDTSIGADRVMFTISRAAAHWAQSRPNGESCCSTMSLRGNELWGFAPSSI